MKKKSIRSNETTVVIAGKEYKSTVEVAKALSISKNTLYTRIHEYGSLEKAVQYSLSISFIIDGKVYSTYKDAAKALGIHIVSIYRKMIKGCTNEEIVNYYKTKPKAGRSEPLFVIDGIDYYTMSSAAKALGTSTTTIGRCIKKGMSSDEIVEYINKKCANMTYSIENNYGDKVRNVHVSYIDSDGVVYYMMLCATCGRHIAMTMQEARNFQHSDKICISKSSSFSKQKLA